jgi:hypothetical protein
MSGLKKEFKRKKHAHFSEAERRMIIEDYLQSGLSKREIWEKYTGNPNEHGLLLCWMYKYGYMSDNKDKNSIFVPKIDNNMSVNEPDDKLSDFELSQWQKRVLDLERQHHESEMNSIAWQHMIELAEKEFDIKKKKKFNTKPSKK